MMFLSIGVIHNIVNRLCYVDRIPLKLSCQFFNKIISQKPFDFKSIVLKKLKKHLPNAESFLEILRQNKAVITGSFILACLYDTDDYNDIDVYEYAENEQKGADITEISHFLHKTFNYDFRLYEEVYSIRDFQAYWIKVQHIIIHCDVKKYINATFDLDLCKSCFDGEKLYIKSWKKLFEKYDYIKPNALLMSFYEESQIQNKSKDRQIKYLERGFKIMQHPLYHQIIDYIKKRKLNRSFAYQLVDQVNLDQFYLE